MHALDRYQVGASALHHWAPRVKVVVALLFIVSNVLLPDGSWLAFLLTQAALFGISAAAGLGPTFAARRSFVVLPFMLAAVTIIFTLPGQPIADWTLGPWRLVATDAGLVRFVSIIIRALLSAQVAILLTATTTFPDLLHALRDLRVPAVLVAIISFMYRYLFVLTDEATRLLRARAARSARPAHGGGGGSIAWRARVAGHMAGQLFVRGYDRGERVYQAMLARGYTGTMLSLHSHALRPADWALAGGGMALLLLLQAIARLPVLQG